MSDRKTAITALAYERWNKREQQFPAFARRSRPDALDYASGSWAKCLAEAADEYDNRTRYVPPGLLL